MKIIIVLILTLTTLLSSSDVHGSENFERIPERYARSANTGDDDRIYFPDSNYHAVIDRTTHSVYSNNDRIDVKNRNSENDESSYTESELDDMRFALAQQLNSVDNLRDFNKMYVEKKAVIIGSRFGSDDDIETNEVALDIGKCQPDLTVVPVEIRNTRFLQAPTCTRVRRCSGCCNTPRLECQPTAFRNVTINVQLFSFDNNRQRKIEESREVILEEHVACGCGCKVKKEDCSHHHKYNPENCKCECHGRRFVLEERRCQQRPGKTWNNSTCSCQCAQDRINASFCSTGSSFNNITCRCERD